MATNIHKYTGDIPTARPQLAGFIVSQTNKLDSKKSPLKRLSSTSRASTRRTNLSA